MSAPVVKVGDRVVHVERIGTNRRILETAIVRETAKVWVDATGWRWRKTDGAATPKRAGCGPRFIMSVIEFEASQVKL